MISGNIQRYEKWEALYMIPMSMSEKNSRETTLAGKFSLKKIIAKISNAGAGIDYANLVICFNQHTGGIAPVFIELGP